MLALGIDLGTSGLRVAAIRADGAPVGLAQQTIAPDSRRDARAWWQAATAAIRALGETVALSEVRAIAVDGTSGSIVPIDAEGTPLAPASLYNDTASATAVASVLAVAEADSAARGSTSPLARLLSWRTLPRIARVLHEADWLAGMLCGRFDTSDENNALKTGYDPRRGQWPDAVRGLAGDLLPRIVAAGESIGRITAAAAATLRLATDVAVVAGTTDGCAAFLATGAHESGEAVTSLGSTLTLKLMSDRPVFAPQFGIYSHKIRGRWLAGGASNTGGAALARHFDPATLAKLSAAIDPARDSGLDYYPLPAPGERFPIADPALAPRETPRPETDAAFLHGLLEGIARIEALGYARLAELGTPALRSVRSVGGGARNATWTALRARLLGVPMPPARSEEAAVGTATLALAGLAA